MPVTVKVEQNVTRGVNFWLAFILLAILPLLGICSANSRLNRAAGAKVCFGRAVRSYRVEVRVSVTELIKPEIQTLNLKFNIMLKTIYIIFGTGVILFYMASSWFGWEIANSGSSSRFGMPFIYTGFRGGK